MPLELCLKYLKADIKHTIWGNFSPPCESFSLLGAHTHLFFSCLHLPQDCFICYPLWNCPSYSSVLAKISRLRVYFLMHLRKCSRCTALIYRCLLWGLYRRGLYFKAKVLALFYIPLFCTWSIECLKSKKMSMIYPHTSQWHCAKSYLAP